MPDLDIASITFTELSLYNWTSAQPAIVLYRPALVLYKYHLLVPQILIALHWQYCWVRGRGYVQVSFYPIGCRRQPCPWHVGERATMIENYFQISFFEIFVNRQSTHVEQWFSWSNTRMFKNFEETAAREQDSLQKFSNQNRGNCLTGL